MLAESFRFGISLGIFRESARQGIQEPCYSGANNEIERDNVRGSVLILAPNVYRDALPDLNREFGMVYFGDTSVRPVRAVLTGAGVPIPDNILELYPEISFISIAGASVKKYNVRDLISRGVVVHSASAAYADAVAEFQVMQAIMGLRKAILGHEVMRAGGWGFAQSSFCYELIWRFLFTLSRVSLIKYLKTLFPARWEQLREAHMPAARPAMRSLKGITVGMLGFGHITKKGIEKFTALGAKVIVHSKYADNKLLTVFGAEPGGFADVMRSDVVLINRGLSSRTEGSIGATELNMLKPHAVFINSSRGKIVDENALIARAARGDITVCLDVFAEEPLSSKNPLRQMRNVFLTPHIAGSTREMCEEARAESVRAVVEYLREGSVNGSITTVEQYENMT